MSTQRSLPALLLSASIGAAALGAFLAPEAARAGDYCDGFNDYPKIKAACKAGANDEKKMRKQMKDWQKTAKDKGGDFKCTTCHTKSSGGETKDGVKEKWKEFEKLL